MWVRLELDFGWWDLAFGMTRLLQPVDENAPLTIEKLWPNAFPVLSVRSGFDLFLGAMQWPQGSEVVFSALNIPDMPMIARQHGLIAVPADLDIDRLAPNLDRLEHAISPHTRAIVIAHLYGNFVDLQPIIDLARRHDLLLIEDCAENYDGVYTGHPDADVSLFSFGPLKTATALAGGVLRTRDPHLVDRLREQHERWPIQSRRDYFNRLCKYGTMKFFGGRWIYGETRRMARLVAGDVDQLISHTAKSFRDDEIMNRLRQRPSGPLLASLARRLSGFDHERIRQRTANGRLLANLLRGRILCPGADGSQHNYWLFPVLLSDVEKSLRALEAAGFDAARVTSMRAIDAPADRLELDPVQTKAALEHMLLLPCYPGLPESELRRMADVLIRVEEATTHVEALKVTVTSVDTVYERAQSPATALGHSSVESVAHR